MAKAVKKARQVKPAAASAPPSLNRLLARVSRNIEGEGVRVVTTNLAESPLAWLVRRGMVSARQFEAGERLRDDFMRAGLAPSVTMRWHAVADRRRYGPAEALDPTMAQLAAKQRFEGAAAAAGPGLNDVLWRVVCLGEGLVTAEAALGWPVRAGKLVLGLALDRVADFYGVR